MLHGSMSDIHERIRAALEPAIQQIVELLRSEARQEIAQQILGHVDTVVTAPRETTISIPRSAPPAPRRAPSSGNRLIPKHCIFPDCKHPSKGPRFTFMCDEHVGLSKKEKAKYLAEWKTAHR